jgi:ribA/ribD-fused uncharacterized protein
VRYAILFATVVLIGCAAHDRNVAISDSPPATRSAARAATAPAKIAAFEGEYHFLSNFYPAVIVFEGITYPSVEHAYQSAKTTDMNERRRIAAIIDPANAKVAGRKLDYRPDWETVKFDVMETCVRYKFTHHPELREKLLATGDAELIEGNTWNDRIWGVYQGQGENRLGKTLMKVRDELRAADH